MILCDIGNTTYHFKTKQKNFKISIDASLDELPKFKNNDIYFISVNKKATKIFLKKYPHATNIEDMVHFQTSYKGMGIDRQVVCKYVQHGIIIDAGSAITVDLMLNKQHKGGFILPGLQSFAKTYSKISKKLSFKFENDINLDKIPLKTNDAINYAILNSIVLPITNMHDKYKTPLYFTGGDSKSILKYFKNKDKVYQKDLIFKSMKKIIENSKKDKKC